MFKKLIAGLIVALLLQVPSAAQEDWAYGRDLGFSISVDGEIIAGQDFAAAAQRRADVGLERVDIQVKFDGLDVAPMLDVATRDVRTIYQPGEIISFQGISNYPSWIARSEVRIFAGAMTRRGTPIASVALDGDGIANWQVPEDGFHKFQYVLRVYDRDGRFDETLPRELERSPDAVAALDLIGPVTSDKDHTSFRNIPIYGGSVTVFGRNVPEGYIVRALGETLNVDGENSFVIQRILPPGVHSVDVSVASLEDEGVQFNREINIPKDEWFFVGLADITLGNRFGSKHVVAANPDKYDAIYAKGRLAFYLKGKIQGKYLLTAAADTTEAALDEMFTGLDSKDPREVLKRLDPDAFYPVYGDGSTSVDDAPTAGKFYIRLARGGNHVMWGKYKTRIASANFIRSERAHYGGQVVYASEQVTEFGENVITARGYGAQPGSLTQRDSMRGTGGSAYFLSHQDISHDSETASIELRELTSGVVVARTMLVPGQDYRIDSVQGVIILDQPLASNVSGAGLVRDNALGDYGQHLVVQYNYSPALGSVDGYDFGGQAQVWINDKVRVGVAGLSQRSGVAENAILGADVHLRLGKSSFVEAEVALSEGPGNGGAYSADGGLTINALGTSGVAGQGAGGYSIKGQVDLADLNTTLHGSLNGYLEKREAGFTSLDFETLSTQTVWGVSGGMAVSENVVLKGRYDDFSNEAGGVKKTGNVDVEVSLSDKLKVAIGAKFSKLANIGSALTTGTRTELGGRLSYQVSEDTKAYLFGQKTVEHTGSVGINDRLGAGGEIALTELLGLRGEISQGTSGFGGLAALTYDPSEGNHYYIGYQIDPDRAPLGGGSAIGQDLGTVVMGMKRRHSEALSSYAENGFDMFGKRRALTTTYGVIYTPDSRWSFNGGFEYGQVSDLYGTDLNRTAVSGSVGYQEEDRMDWSMRGEARFEKNSAGVKRETFLAAVQMNVKTNKDWRMVSSADAVLSHSDQSSLLDGDYIKGSFGYAYRPATSDRLNGLVKYTFLYDLPGADQVTASGTKLGPAQRSHIFTGDVSYDVSPLATIGAKYGFRIGAISATRNAADFVTSSAHLGVLRVDVHVVQNWDVLIEGRVRSAPEAKSFDYGLLAAVYRHIGDSLKVGAGYNFGQFSDDLSDLTYDDGGVFVNIVGKF